MPPTRGSVSRTAVLGLGNPVLADDAFGLRVAEKLQEILRAEPLPGVEVLRSARAGFELIDMLHGYDRAVIVDALDVSDPEPGRVRRLDLGRFAGSARLTSPHDLDVATAFEFAARMGISMPESVEIFAVEAADVRTLSETMTAEVEAAVDPLARQIHGMLKRSAVAPGGGESSESAGP